MKLRDVIKRDVEVISQDAPLQEAAERMKVLDVGFLPVVDGNRIVGIVTDRDITVRAIAAGRDPAATRVREIHTPDIVYGYEDQDVEEAARLMGDKQIRRLIVVDADKRLVGIVSLGDLAVDAGDERLAGRTLDRVSQPAGFKP